MGVTSMSAEVVPAILVYTRAELLSRIELTKQHVKTIQIDMMDGIFVPNKTLSISDVKNLPSGVHYEFHWMVQDPQNWINEIKGPYLHLIPVETIASATHWSHLKQLVRSQGGTIGLVLEPHTSLDALDPYLKDAAQVLVMSVHSGFDGQVYLPSVEEKIRTLRTHHPSLDIEIDGGINKETIVRAAKAGANKFAAASALFKAPNIPNAVKDLLTIVKMIRGDSS